MHEILHALGIFHEQSRNDRDRFVKVVWENVSRRELNEIMYGNVMHNNLI